MSANFKREQEKAAPRTCVCPRKSSSMRSKWWKLSRNVPYQKLLHDAAGAAPERRGDLKLLEQADKALKLRGVGCPRQRKPLGSGRGPQPFEKVDVEDAALEQVLLACSPNLDTASDHKWAPISMRQAWSPSKA